MRSLVRCILATVPLWLALPAEAQRRAPPPLPTLSAEALDALQQLDSVNASEIGLRQGWFRDRSLLYYDFGRIGKQVVGNVLWPIHGFDARGNPVAIRGQRPLFSSIPGVPNYSGIWRVAYIVTADHVQPNQIRDIAAAEALVKRRRATLRETNVTYNMPIVPRGTRLARDSSQGMLGWFEGREVQFFDFGEVGLDPVPLWRFIRGVDASGEPDLLLEQASVVDTIPVSPPYPDLWEIRFVRTDSTYVPNTHKSAAAVARAGVVIEETGSIRNCPIVIVDGTRIERVPSPLRAFADLRSPFPPALTRVPR